MICPVHVDPLRRRPVTADALPHDTQAEKCQILDWLHNVSVYTRGVTEPGEPCGTTRRLSRRRDCGDASVFSTNG
jgi:hypothetical protein